jgi:hypothetical protein
VTDLEQLFELHYQMITLGKVSDGHCWDGGLRGGGGAWVW